MWVLRVGDAVVGGDDKANFRVAQAWHLFKGNDPLPLVFARPAGHRQPGVRPGADGHLAAGAIADLAVDIGDEDVIAGINPGAQCRLELGEPGIVNCCLFGTIVEFCDVYNDALAAMG